MTALATGRNLRAAIIQAELIELYDTQRLTIDKIAAKFGVAATTIARRFKA
jgi:AraC-like DNA-binding protein